MSAPSTDEPFDEGRGVRRLEKLQRENRRLRETVSFRLGFHLTDAVRKPWKIIVLPLSFPLLCLKIGLERLGKIPRNHHINEEKKKFHSTNTTVLFPTNGVGFGHFTRMYALAKELRKKRPEMEIIFFTTMPTLHVPYLDDFPTYHLAGKHKFDEMDATTWNMLVEEMLSLIFDTHAPKNFIFDGAFPYRGMLDAIHGRTDLAKIWIRRGMFKRGKSVPAGSIEHFDLIVHPGDAVEVKDSEIQHNVEILKTEPILLIDRDTMFSRVRARSRLGVPNDAVVVYVQLGAGQINDIDSEIRITVDCLLEYEEIFVVIGESMLGERIEISNPRVTILRDYPNSLYFNAFDFSIQAGGYNSFHEMRNMKLPTLFYPNLNTGMDDQKSRCLVAEDEGWGIVNTNRNIANISKDIKKLLKLEMPKDDNFTPQKNGTETIADRIA